MKKINESDSIQNTEHVTIIDMYGGLVWRMGDIGLLILMPNGSVHIYKQLKYNSKFLQNGITLCALRSYELSNWKNLL